jgi:MoxR-like ATPase
MQTNHATEAEIQAVAPALQELRRVLQGVLLGQDAVVERVLVGMLARGHVLLEGLPGLGKTELVKAISKAVGLQSRRIQFTPDLLPGDVTGTPVLVEDGGGRKLVFQPGPVFAQLVLGDEINRASPKTQSALLEAMQERQVTVMGETRPLPEPFFVLATQNPIELEGTYPLPEAQLDRFLFKVEVGHNSVEVLERIVLEREIGVSAPVEPVMDCEKWKQAMALARRVFVPKVVANYIARIVAATQSGPNGPGADLKFGASPRAVLALAAGARARALLEGRINTGFEDVQALAVAVLGHRLILDYRARVAGKTTASVVAHILECVTPDGAEVPPTLRDARL